jgi:hypothetical protein
MSQSGEGGTALLFLEGADLTDTRASSIVFFFSNKYFPPLKSHILHHTIHKRPWRKVVLVVALLLFFKVAQEVVDHHIRHANVKQAQT